MYFYDDGSHHETIWRVCVDAYGSTVFVVRSASAEGAIECAVDCAIENGLSGLFTDVEYPEGLGEMDDGEMWEAIADAETDLYVVGHTTMPEGWGTAIPSWEIGLCEADDDDRAAFERWRAAEDEDEIEAWRDESEGL